MEREVICNLTEENFDHKTGRGTMIVDFWAPWCGPCRSQSGILDGMVQRGELPDGVSIGKVNVDEQPELAMRYDVSAIPTLLVFKEGRQVERLEGVQSAERLVASL
ncbi:MAG: thioredoxin domain-containing protein [Planctomycetia bacterium]|nr:thioredoxin domain-containing protein [Planctomycetia bacterium]